MLAFVHEGSRVNHDWPGLERCSFLCNVLIQCFILAQSIPFHPIVVTGNMIYLCTLFQNIPASEKLVRGKRKSAILKIQVLSMKQIMQQQQRCVNCKIGKTFISRNHCP